MSKFSKLCGMIQQRIIKFIDYKGITKYKFYKKTGLSNGFLDKKGTIGADKCEIICSFFPEISVEWLITGKGEMLKKSIPYKKQELVPNVVNEPRPQYGVNYKSLYIEVLEENRKLSKKIIQLLEGNTYK